MHHMGGPMVANNMNMGPRAPAPMMGNMGPGGRVGRGGMPAPGIQSCVWLALIKRALLNVAFVYEFGMVL